MPDTVSFRRLRAAPALATEEGSPLSALRDALADCPTACPQWCFVAEAGGGCLAAAGFRGSRRLPMMPDHLPQDLYLLGLWAAWDDPKADRVCADLVRRALATLHAEGAQMLTVYLDISEPDAGHKVAVLDALRLPLFQERVHYVYDPTRTLPSASPRLSYRTLGEVGREPFVTAIRRVNQDSLDRGIRQNVRFLGERRSAEQTFDEIADKDWQGSYQARVWRLAYDADGMLIGLVMPIIFWEGRAAIGFIGVVPEERGKSYANELLAEGTRLLVETGQTEIVADIDRDNLPMAAALARIGYELQGGERIYDAALGEWLKAARAPKSAT